MKICKFCNSPNEDGAFSCRSCGATEFFRRCARCGEVFDSPFCPRCGLKAGEKAKKCPVCSTEYHSAACPNCGYIPAGKQNAVALRSAADPFPIPAREYAVVEAFPAVSSKSRLAALLLLLFFGGAGIHRFYVGKIGTGILFLLTAGFLGIGVLIDLIMILCGTFQDRLGLPVKKW